MEMIQQRGGMTDGSKWLRRCRGRKGKEERGGKGRQPRPGGSINLKSRDTSSVVTGRTMERTGQKRKVAHLMGAPQEHSFTPSLLRDRVIY